MKIKAEIEQAAILHLNVKDIDSALRNYSDDMIAISNTSVFSSQDELENELRGFYNILKTVIHASWKDININVISEKAALFTAKFDYGFTSKTGEQTNLSGVWTALFIREDENWKIRLRHESFEEK